MMSMIDHLGELRSRLIKSLIVFAVISVIAFILFKPITDFLLDPLCSLPKNLLGSNGCKLTSFGVLEPLNVRIKITALTGLIFASPFWLYQLYAFVVPGLTAKEKSYAIPFLLTSIALFLIGATFAYLTMPAAIHFLVGLGNGQIITLFRAQDYLNFVGLIIIVFGVTFELPILLFFLGMAGILPVETLRRQRRVAIVGIVALAAVVTPSQDPYTMLAMAVPLYAFYELTIVLLSVIAKRKAKASTGGGSS
ncbi:MAG: sec-independent protein translocase protein TatC [Actinomycetota bacterium]|nr:sec-independent protein translocase protein TatC [Actinomycetota bacterium]